MRDCWLVLSSKAVLDQQREHSESPQISVCSEIAQNCCIHNCQTFTGTLELSNMVASSGTCHRKVYVVQACDIYEYGSIYGCSYWNS